MVDYLTHYYKRDAPPFRSLSALPDDAAIRVMEALYEETIFGARFRNPAEYLRERRQTEQWVRELFIAKGGRPQEPYPIYTVLGTSPWIVAGSGLADLIPCVHIPLSILDEGDVSFTYPDSMISHWFGADMPAAYYLPGVHGQVFTKTEILAIVEDKGMPEEGWQTNLPPDLAPYIEGQVWNRQRVLEYVQSLDMDAV